MPFRREDLMEPRLLVLLAVAWFLGPLAAFLLWYHFSWTVLLIMCSIALIYAGIFVWFLARIIRR